MDEEKSTPERGGWSWKKKLLLQLLLLPLLPLGVEALYRVYLRTQGEAYEAEEARAQARQLYETMIDRTGLAGIGGGGGDLNQGPKLEMVPHPFFGFDFVHMQEFAENTRKYYLTKMSRESYDVAIVGGSVAAGFGHHGRTRLLERLRGDPRFAGRGMKVHVFARGSGKQPEQLNIVNYLLGLGHEFDAVINLDGFNEVALANGNRLLDAHPLHPSAPYWSKLVSGSEFDDRTMELLARVQGERDRSLRMVESWEDRGLYRSAILGTLALSNLRKSRARHGDGFQKLADHLAEMSKEANTLGPPWDGEFETAMDMAVKNWMECSRSLQAVCDARSIYYVHVLQPTLHDEGSKRVVTDDEVRTGRPSAGWEQAVDAGYSQLREGGARIAGEGVNFLDATYVFLDVEDTLYYDACHFSVEGNELLADRIAAHMLATLPPE